MPSTSQHPCSRAQLMHCGLGFSAARQMRAGSLAGPKDGMYRDFVSWSHIAGLCCVKPRSQCTKEACHPHLPIIASPATFRSMHNLCGHGVQDGTAEGCHGLLWK